MSAQTSFLDDIAAANRDEAAPEPQHIRRQQMQASWMYARGVYLATWHAGLQQAQAAGNAELAAWYQRRIIEVEGIRE